MRLLQREAELVTSHELGHNWGSEHDPNDNVNCAPSTDGNYIMYAFSNKGYDPNNYVRFFLAWAGLINILNTIIFFSFVERNFQRVALWR